MLSASPPATLKGSPYSAPSLVPAKSATLVDRHALVDGDVGERLHGAGGPRHLDLRHTRIAPESERQRELALRGVARSAPHHLPRGARRARHPDDCAKPA